MQFKSNHASAKKMGNGCFAAYTLEKYKSFYRRKRMRNEGTADVQLPAAR
jgi:hypothetical protein